MLSASNLPIQYYSDAILMASYLYNRTIHGSDKTTPYEQMLGSPPSWGHLRPFGCIGYAFIPSEKRTDLDPSRSRCRLLGYADDFSPVEHKGYRLLRESDLAIFYSNDVEFWDDVSPPTLPDETLYDPQFTADDIFGDPTFVPPVNATNHYHSSPISSGFALPNAPSIPLQPHYARTLVSSRNILPDTPRDGHSSSIIDLPLSYCL